MANPQIENGHTQISNEILEQLMKRYLTPNQWQVLICIIRKTYGYHKKEDYIANSQICEATGLGKSVVSRALWSLEAMNIISRKGKFVGFQKDWEKWEKLATLLTKEKLAEQSTLDSKLANQLTGKKLAVQATELAVQLTKVSSPRDTQKKKETIQKKVVVPETLEEYTEKILKPLFPELDFKVEREKFDTWWAEGNKKLTRPKSAFMRWCENAERYRIKDNTQTSLDKPKERLIKDQIKELEDRGIKF